MHLISYAAVLDKNWLGLHPKAFKELNIKVKKFRQHTAVSCPLNVPIGHIILQKKHSAHLPGAGYHARRSLHYLICSQKQPFEAGATVSVLQMKKPKQIRSRSRSW